jgi:hypothetical protein
LAGCGEKLVISLLDAVIDLCLEWEEQRGERRQ